MNINKYLAIIVGLALLGLPALFGLPGCGNDSSPVAVARVNGDNILLSDFSAQIAFMGLGNDPAALAPDLRQAVLDSLVRRRLIMAQGKIYGIGPDSPELTEELVKARQGQDKESFHRNLASQGLDEEVWARVLSEEILARLTLQAAVAAKTLISAEEIQAYYQANQEAFSRPEQILAQHVVLPSRKLAQQLLQEVEAGKDMGKAAAALGVSMESEGQPAWLSRGHMPSELEAKIFSVKRGKVAGPFASTYGFHVVRIIEKRPARRLTVAQAAVEIRRRLATDRKEELAAQWIADLVGQADIWFDPGFRATGRIGRTLQ